MFKFFKGDVKELILKYIPEDHHIINISTDMYEPFNFNLIRVIYHKHMDPHITEVHKMVIGEGHPLWNWPDIM
jgi:hypothetical protein